LQARVAALEGGLRPFAAWQTTDELLQSGPPAWARAGVAQRLEMIADNKRKRDDEILAARALLADAKDGDVG
jgi:hypothetical protein